MAIKSSVRYVFTIKYQCDLTAREYKIELLEEVRINNERNVTCNGSEISSVVLEDGEETNDLLFVSLQVTSIADNVQKRQSYYFSFAYVDFIPHFTFLVKVEETTAVPQVLELE
jgi:hypothetical protein